MNTDIFIVAFLGSVGLELVEVITAYQQRGRLPRRYMKKGFWLVRLCFALIAGALPVLFRVTSTPEAFAVGVCAPIVFRFVWERGLGHPPAPSGLR